MHAALPFVPGRVMLKTGGTGDSAAEVRKLNKSPHGVSTYSACRPQSWLRRVGERARVGW